MSSEEFLWYQLFRTKGFGPKRLNYIFRALCERRLELEDLFEMAWEQFEEMFPELSRESFEEIRHKSNSDKILAEFQTIKNKRVQIVYLGHPSYPNHVRSLLGDSAPALIFCGGQLSLLNADGIAVVGSRDASKLGLETAKRFGAELAIEGENVVSGYAKGIDTNAHLGALERDGTTTIVLSYGILHFSKKKLFENVRWHGNILAVSQFPPAEKWRVTNAMARNKLVCALSQAVIVIEANKTGGTFDEGITALKLGLPLFVVSPSEFDRQPLGNKKLIEEGGIEIDPKHGIRTLLAHIERQATKVIDSPTSVEQLPLFTDRSQNSG